MKNHVRFVCTIAAIIASSVVATAHSYGMAAARAGRVVDVQFGSATRNQVDRDRYVDEQYYRPQPQRSYAGTAVGGAVGALLGAVAGRHSGVGRTLGGFGLGAIGTAVGNEVDQRRYQRTVAEMNRQQILERQQRYGRHEGAQVIVRFDDGQTVAVFVPNAATFHSGQKVWMIDNDQLVPASM